MKKALVLVAAVAAVLAVSALPAGAADEVDDCPADFQLVATPEPHLADRNADRAVCGLRLSLDGRTLQLWTDNAIGNPHIIPPGPCTDPWTRIGVGNPHIIGDPHLRAIDANGDGAVCATASVRGLILILSVVDNPNALARAER
jgi:hypothetical protein